MLDVARQAVARLHDNKEAPMRWGYVYGNGKPYDSHGGCFYGMQMAASDAKANKAPYFYTAFHGDGAQLTFDALRSTKAFNAALREHKQAFNEFKGTERTEEWVAFLISDASPWKLLNTNLAVDDPSFINQAGFIWKDLSKIPSKLWYNFVMAYRLPWEFPKAFGLWRELYHGGMHPALALYVCLNFELAEKADSIQGPYNLVYPWSALEETCYEAVGRFVSGAPASTSVDETMSPNVHPLWQIKNNERKAEADKVFEDFNNREVLMLSEISNALDALIVSQREVF